MGAQQKAQDMQRQFQETYGQDIENLKAQYAAFEKRTWELANKAYNSVANSVKDAGQFAEEQAMQLYTATKAGLTDLFDDTLGKAWENAKGLMEGNPEYTPAIFAEFKQISEKMLAEFENTTKAMKKQSDDSMKMFGEVTLGVMRGVKEGIIDPAKNAFKNATPEEIKYE